VYLWLLFARYIYSRFWNNSTGGVILTVFPLVNPYHPLHFPHQPSLWGFRQILPTCFIFQATFFRALLPNKWLVWKSAVTPRWNLFVRRITSSGQTTEFRLQVTTDTGSNIHLPFIGFHSFVYLFHRQLFSFVDQFTALRLSATGATWRIRILPMNQYDCWLITFGM
jgi:hypothetical protein